MPKPYPAVTTRALDLALQLRQELALLSLDNKEVQRIYDQVAAISERLERLRRTP